MLELTVGIVGMTGIVGQTIFDLLSESSSGFIVQKLKIYASKNSVGKVYNFQNTRVAVEEPDLASLLECNVVFFAADSSIASEFIPKLAEKGVLCIDKSSAFRNHASVPLVVPEVNGNLLSPANLTKFPVVASPNCCTIPLVMVLKALHDQFDLAQVIVSTYQSVSGAGKPGVNTLIEETKAFFSSQDLSCGSSPIFPKSIAFNVMPFVTDILENGDTDEEAKIIAESRKILDMSNLLFSATSVRVPTFVGHAESVTLGFKKKISLEKVNDALANFAGIRIVDGIRRGAEINFNENNSDNSNIKSDAKFITPREAQGTNDVYVSRIRRADVFENGVSLWLVCDNLRKGAALNAIQILEACVANKTVQTLQKQNKINQ